MATAAVLNPAAVGGFGSAGGDVSQSRTSSSKIPTVFDRLYNRARNAGNRHAVATLGRPVASVTMRDDASLVSHRTKTSSKTAPPAVLAGRTTWSRMAGRSTAGSAATTPSPLPTHRATTQGLRPTPQTSVKPTIAAHPEKLDIEVFLGDREDHSDALSIVSSIGTQSVVSALSTSASPTTARGRPERPSRLTAPPDLLRTTQQREEARYSSPFSASSSSSPGKGRGSPVFEHLYKTMGNAGPPSGTRAIPTAIAMAYRKHQGDASTGVLNGRDAGSDSSPSSRTTTVCKDSAEQKGESSGSISPTKSESSSHSPAATLLREWNHGKSLPEKPSLPVGASEFRVHESSAFQPVIQPAPDLAGEAANEGQLWKGFRESDRRFERLSQVWKDFRERDASRPSPRNAFVRDDDDQGSEKSKENSLKKSNDAATSLRAGTKALDGADSDSTEGEKESPSPLRAKIWSMLVLPALARRGAGLGSSDSDKASDSDSDDCHTPMITPTPSTDAGEVLKLCGSLNKTAAVAKPRTAKKQGSTRGQAQRFVTVCIILVAFALRLAVHCVPGHAACMTMMSPVPSTQPKVESSGVAIDHPVARRGLGSFFLGQTSSRLEEALADQLTLFD